MTFLVHGVSKFSGCHRTYVDVRTHVADWEASCRALPCRVFIAARSSRMHFKIGKIPPVEYEQAHYRQQTTREDPISENPASTAAARRSPDATA